jgi:DNA-binding response OmpR family regulator
MPYTVMVVDDDESLIGFLANELAADGYRLAAARSADAACGVAETIAPDVIVVGEATDPAAAVALLDAIRSGAQPFDPETVVVVLSPTSGAVDVLRAFEHGADDVVPRSVEYPELRARLRALLRRERLRRPDDVLSVGELEIDTRTRLVLVAGQAVPLTRVEFALVVCLAREPDRVFEKDELMRHVWGYPHDSRTRTLDSHLCRLRHKLAVNGERRWVHNVWGVGYALINTSPANDRRALRRRRAIQSAGSDWLPQSSGPGLADAGRDG